MTRTTFAIIVALLCWLGPAAAGEATPDGEHGRFSFTTVADGVLRLDLQTGEVSLCSQRVVGWACQAAPDDRVVLENEIARLRAENAALKKELIAHSLPLPSAAGPEPAAPPVSHDGEHAPQAGVNADLEQMAALAGRLWHRFVDAIARAQKQVLNNKS